MLLGPTCCSLAFFVEVLGPMLTAPRYFLLTVLKSNYKQKQASSSVGDAPYLIAAPCPFRCLFLTKFGRRFSVFISFWEICFSAICAVQSLKAVIIVGKTLKVYTRDGAVEEHQYFCLICIYSVHS